MENFDRIVKTYTSWFDNDYVSGFLIVFMIVYASMIAPKLPLSVAKLFDYTWFKLLLLFLIAFISKKNPKVALFSAIALVITIIVLNKLQLQQNILLSDLKSIISSQPIANSPDAQLLIGAAHSEMTSGAIEYEHFDAVTQHVIDTINDQQPLLAVRTPEGEQRLQELNEATKSGAVDPRSAKLLGAKVVVHDILSSIGQGLLSLTKSSVESNDETSAPSQAEEKELESVAQEVIQQKAITKSEKGIEPSSEDIKSMIRHALKKRHLSLSRCDYIKNTYNIDNVHDFDATESMYSPVSNIIV